MGIKYILLLPSSDFPEKELEENYLTWVQKENEISRQFKRNIHKKEISCVKTWHQHRVITCNSLEVQCGSLEWTSSTTHVDAKITGNLAKNGIGFASDYTPSHDETTHSLDFNEKTLFFSRKAGYDCVLKFGKEPSKNQKGKYSTFEFDDFDDIADVVNDDDFFEINRCLNAFSIDTDCIESVKDMVKKQYQDNTSETHLFPHVNRISCVDILEETIVVYPEYTLHVHDSLKTYNVSNRYLFTVPDDAPASNGHILWKTISILSRLSNFAVFLGTLVVAIGLLIFSDTQPKVAMSNIGGLPSLLCGIWIFPINIIGVVIPFFAIDNFAIDIDDFKEKTRAYAIYNLIYLAVAALFICGAHVLMHFICLG